MLNILHSFSNAADRTYQNTVLNILLFFLQNECRKKSNVLHLSKSFVSQKKLLVFRYDQIGTNLEK